MLEICSEHSSAWGCT